MRQPPAVSGRRAVARRWLAGATWLAVAGASTAVLAYSETLWPDRALVLLALWGETFAPLRQVRPHVDR